MDVFEEIKEIVSDVMGIDEDEISLASNFVDDLGVDSLDAIDIVMDVEERFDIDIPDEEMEKMHTIKQLVDYVEFKNNEVVITYSNERW